MKEKEYFLSCTVFGVQGQLERTRKKIGKLKKKKKMIYLSSSSIHSAKREQTNKVSRRPTTQKKTISKNNEFTYMK